MIKNPFLRYCWNVLVLFSQASSVALGGHPDISLSQRIGNSYLSWKNTNTWQEKTFTIVKTTIDKLFSLVGDPNHILGSLEGESQVGHVWHWEKNAEVKDISERMDIK